MSVAYERLIQHLEDREFHYRMNAERESILVDFGGNAGTYRIIARVDADEDLFQVVGVAPIRVPDGSRPAIAETLTRANYGPRVGKFEMDMNDGEVRYQAAHILCEGNLDDLAIRRLIGTTLAMLDRYLPAVLSVIYGNESPDDAIRVAEAA